MHDEVMMTQRTIYNCFTPCIVYTTGLKVYTIGLKVYRTGLKVYTIGLKEVLYLYHIMQTSKNNNITIDI